MQSLRDDEISENAPNPCISASTRGHPFPPPARFGTLHLSKSHKNTRSVALFDAGIAHFALCRRGGLPAPFCGFCTPNRNHRKKLHLHDVP